MNARRRKLRRVALGTLAWGSSLGLFGILPLCFCLNDYSGASQTVPPWIGPLSGLGELCLILAPICLLVALGAFILSYFRSDGPHTES